jgi:HAE1 family hydrophobic/amphiphilic exporter-1
MFSKFFIERPVLSNVLAIVLVLVGALAVMRLPAAQYPDIVPPTVQVTTRYPGASAQTVIDSVALPIENQVNGVERALYMQSTSASDGTYTLIVTFAIGTDLDFAQVLVQNKVSAALASLPAPVQAQGVTVQKKSTAVLMYVTLDSPDGRFDSLFMSNYATINLVNELARLPGVGNVNVFGAGEYAMRVWMDPPKMYALGLVPQDIVNAISQQSQQVTGGQIGIPPTPPGQDFQYTVNIQGRLSDPAQFENIVVRSATANGGRLLRVKDVARVELGAQTYSQAFRLDGRPAAGISIYLTPSANALAVAKLVQEKMVELARDFPAGLRYSIPFDTTTFVQTSINEVYVTLGEAGVLVLIVILVFLQNWRASLVPATTIPVTIIGAFAAMAALGFTINLSTLFGVVLAIGIVVDDAIVVVESVSRHIEAGVARREAAVKAMTELIGPIVGITLVLMSVFIPAAFLPGLTGRMFAQFALVIAATALLSAIMAATLSPTQCGFLLRAPVPPEQRNFFFRGFNFLYDRLERGYTGLVGWMARHSALMVVVALALTATGVYGIARLPTAFIPNEDQGYGLIAVQLPDGASLARTEMTIDQAARIGREQPGVATVIAVSGLSILDNNASLANAGVVYVVFKPWNERGKAKDQDLRSIMFGIRARLSELTDGTGFVLVPPPIQGVGNAGGFTMQLLQRDGTFDYAKMLASVNAVRDAADSQSAIERTVSTFRADSPQIQVVIDRAKAETLRVSVGSVFAAVSSYLGSTYVNEFNKFGLTLQVYVQADSPYRLHPEDLLKLNVKSADGNTVPIGALAQIKPAVGPSLISLFNLYLTATISGAEARGFSSGQAMSVMSQTADHVLPPGTGFAWSGMSYQEQAVGNQLYLAFALSLLLVYLCLAGQYESWLSPLSVLLAVPLSLLGPVAVLTGLGIANNLYVQIGLMLLIALSAKNAILIVEVAREHRAVGEAIVDAAVEAARTRFRPILMTSFAFLLGVLPLVTATGAGANARRSLGISTFSGMLASTCLAVLFVPSFFVVMQHLQEYRGAKRATTAPVAAPPAAAGG